MKAIIISFCIFISMASYGQISIVQTDMPDVDDTIRTSITYYTAVDYTLTGPSFNWDFSGLIPLMQQVDTFVSVWSTPLVYNLVFIYPLVSTIAKARPDNKLIPGYQLTNIFDFFKETSSYFALVGYGTELNGIPIPVKYDNPDYLYHFPVSYGTMDSSSSTFSQAISGIGYFGEIKKRVNHLDGWGNLSTPFGSFQTIRIKSEIETFDTLYMDTLGIGFGIPRFITEYKWLAKGFGLPLLSISVSGLITTITYIDSARNTLIGSEELSTKGDDISVYPNPASDIVYINCLPPNFELRSASIELVDINGKVWKKHIIDPNERSYSIDVKNLPGGMYMILIKNKDSIVQKKFLIIK